MQRVSSPHLLHYTRCHGLCLELPQQAGPTHGPQYGRYEPQYPPSSLERRPKRACASLTIASWDIIIIIFAVVLLVNLYDLNNFLTEKSSFSKSIFWVVERLVSCHALAIQEMESRMKIEFKSMPVNSLSLTIALSTHCSCRRQN